MTEYRQTSVTAPVKGFPGQLVEMQPADLASRAVETAAGIEFGRVVQMGTDKDRQVKVGGSVAFGVTVRTNDTEAVTGGYELGDNALILREGYLYVTLAEASTAGDPLAYNSTTGVIVVGPAGGGEVDLPGQVVEGAGGGEVAKIKIVISPEMSALLAEIAAIVERVAAIEDLVPIDGYSSGSTTIDARLIALEGA